MMMMMVMMVMVMMKVLYKCHNSVTLILFNDDVGDDCDDADEDTTGICVTSP